MNGKTSAQSYDIASVLNHQGSTKRDASLDADQVAWLDSDLRELLANRTNSFDPGNSEGRLLSCLIRIADAHGKIGLDLPPLTPQERIERQAQLLRERINEILYLGNLKSGERAPEPFGPVDLRPLVDGVLKDLDQKAQERQVRFDSRVPPIVIPGNAEQLKILFTNLILNAVLYSNEGGAVEIIAREERERALVLVVDHGIGIRDEALPHIFEDFYRTREGARFNRMSTGLGLAIVREIARNCGLRIVVASELGKGTTFEVAIPRRKDMSPGG